MCCFKKNGKIHNSDTQPQLITNLPAATPLSGAALLFLSFYLKIKRTTQLFINPNNTVIPLLVASAAQSSLKTTLV